MITISETIKRVRPSMTLALNAKAKELNARGEKIISFTVGEPNFNVPAHVEAAAMDAFKKGYTRYTAESGIPELKRAIINRYQSDYQLTFAPEEIIVSCGGKHALYGIMKTLLNPGDEVIIPSPYWLSYPDQVLMNDGVPVFINTTEKNQFKMNALELESKMTAKTKIVILNSPSNPTGEVYADDEVKKIIDVMIMHPDVVLISDEIYDKMVYAGKFKSILQLSDKIRNQTIIVNGVSKSYAMTGLRIGYAIGPKLIISNMSKAQGHATSSPCSISQWAAVAALAGDQSCVETMRIAFKRRRDLMAKLLQSIPKISCRIPDGAFYLFPNVSAYYGKQNIQNSMDMTNYLLDMGKISVVPGKVFGNDDHIRLSYALSDEDIELGIARMKDALVRLVA